MPIPGMGQAESQKPGGQIPPESRSNVARICNWGAIASEPCGADRESRTLSGRQSLTWIAAGAEASHDSTGTQKFSLGLPAESAVRANGGAFPSGRARGCRRGIILIVALYVIDRRKRLFMNQKKTDTIKVAAAKADFSWAAG